MIQDLTAVLKAASFIGSKPDVHAQFEPPVLAIKDGLYVFLFENGSTRRVRDNNSTPKTVISANGASLKPGKFESGFITRMRNYHDHLRREGERGAVEHVFQECLRLALVLDLDRAGRLAEFGEGVRTLLEREHQRVSRRRELAGGHSEWTC